MADYKSTARNGYYLWLRLTESGTNIANNTSVVNYILWLCNGNATFNAKSSGDLWMNGVKLWGISNTDRAITSLNSDIVLASGSRTITHNADGSKSVPFAAAFKTIMQGYNWTVPPLSLSGNFGLATIPRASNPSLGASTTNLGSALLIHMNRKSTAFTHTVKYKLGNKSGTIATRVTNNTTWTLPNNLAEEITTSLTRVGTITVDTYNGSRYIGTSSVTFTARVPDTTTFKPTAIIDSIVEAANLPSIFDPELFIQSKSKFKVTADGTVKYGTEIDTYRITIDGISNNGKTFTSNTINKSGPITITVTVTDKRGLSHSVSTTRTLVEYFAPEIFSFEARRTPTDQSDKITVSFSTRRANVMSTNTRRIQIQYKVSGTSSWSNLLTENNPNMSEDYYDKTIYPSIIFNTDYSYDIRIILSDAFTTSDPIDIETTIGTAFELINWNKSGRGMAIGKVSEHDTFEVGMDAEFYKDVIKYDSLLYMDGGKVNPNGIIDSIGKSLTPIEYARAYENMVVREFKRSRDVDLQSLIGDTYFVTETFVGTDKTGNLGNPTHQTAYVSDNRIYKREGINHEWNKWEIIHGTQVYKLNYVGGFRAYNGHDYNYPRLYVSGKVCHVVGSMHPPSGNSLSTFNEVTFAQMPLEYRPPHEIIIVQHGSSYAKWLFRINENDGTLRAERYEQGGKGENPPTGAWMPFQATWVIE